jgi:hypothetical protein
MNLVHMVIDEMAALGHMETVDDMLSMGRGYGLRVHLFVQNAAQLMRCYPDGQHVFVMGVTSNLFFGAHDWLTCEEVSRRSGSRTVIADSGGDGYGDTRQLPDNGGPGSVGWSHNRNHNWAFAAKPLIRPEQVATLPPRAAITFAPGVRAPILSWITLAHEAPLAPAWPARAWARVKPLLMSLLLLGGAVLITLPAVMPPKQRSPPPKPSTAVPPPSPNARTSWPVSESGRPSRKSPATSMTSSGTGPGRTVPPNSVPP